MFTLNLGSADRLVRLAVGAFLVATPFLFAIVAANVWLAWGLPILGAVLVVTAFFSFCPLYALFGLSSRKRSLP